MQGLRELVDPGAKDLKPRNFTGVSQRTRLTAMIPKRLNPILHQPAIRSQPEQINYNLNEMLYKYM